MWLFLLYMTLKNVFWPTCVNIVLYINLTERWDWVFSLNDVVDLDSFLKLFSQAHANLFIVFYIKISWMHSQQCHFSIKSLTFAFINSSKINWNIHVIIWIKYVFSQKVTMCHHIKFSKYHRAFLSLMHVIWYISVCKTNLINILDTYFDNL